MGSIAHSTLPLLVMSMCVGVLFVGSAIFTYLFTRTRDVLHIVVASMGLAAIAFVVCELAAMFASASGDPELGRRIHRVEALVGCTLLVIVPAYLYLLLKLTPLWRRINAVAATAGGLFLVVASIVAFVAPDLFVSLDAPAPENLGIRWNEVRGRPGPLYYVRDLLVATLLLSVIAELVVEVVLNRAFRRMKWLLGGIMAALLLILVGLTQSHGLTDARGTVFDQLGVAVVGVTLFVIGAMLSVTTQYADTLREAARTQRLQALSLFAAGIAHDFNNVLAGIQGCGDLILRRAQEDEDIRKLATTLTESTAQAAGLVEKLNLFAREESQALAPTSLETILSSSGELVESGTHARDVGVTISIETEPDLRPALVNAGQITRVVQNLLVNAVQAMPGGGTVAVWARNDSARMWRDGLRSRDEHFVRISVSDQGDGIDRKQLGKIFEPYYTTKADGAGLGLAISRSIVEESGGHIYVESRVNVGTVFDVYLPASG